MIHKEAIEDLKTLKEYFEQESGATPLSIEYAIEVLESQQKARNLIRIGDEVYVHGYVDEIRKDVIIIRNEGGYFGTVEDEIVAYGIKELHKDYTEPKVVIEQTEPMTEDLIKRSEAIKALCEDGVWLEQQGVYTLALAEAKQRAVDILQGLDLVKNSSPLVKDLVEQTEP